MVNSNLNTKTNMNMKRHLNLKNSSLIVLAGLVLYGLSACDRPHEHDHVDGDQDRSGKVHDPGEANDDQEKGDDHEDDKIIAGPNGGRVLTSVEPHAEFFVTEDRRVRITFVNDDLEAVPAGDQTVTVIAGDRSAPTQLAFVKNGQVLESEGFLPDGNDFPVVVQIQTSAEAEIVREKFNLDLSDCPTCENLEYACICDH